MSTRCEISFRLMDVTAVDDATLSATNYKPWSDLYQIHDETQTLDPWATLEGDGIPLDGSRLLFRMILSKSLWEFGQTHSLDQMECLQSLPH